jgi:hypothetical protein
MYKGINNITDQDKQLVMVTHQRWASNRLNPDRGDIRLLFNKYHEYVYRSPADMACPSCVQFIFNFWLREINKWK